MSLLLLFSGAAPWQNVLLATATRLADEGEHEVAVVSSMMACETAVERAFAYYFQKRGLADLEDPIEDFFPSYSLANDRVRQFYVALSGDSIQNARFWDRYKEAARVRNQIVHKGARATPEHARDAVVVASEFVAHIGGLLR